MPVWIDEKLAHPRSAVPMLVIYDVCSRDRKKSGESTQSSFILFYFFLGCWNVYKATVCQKYVCVREKKVQKYIQPTHSNNASIHPRFHHSEKLYTNAWRFLFLSRFLCVFPNAFLLFACLFTKHSFFHIHDFLYRGTCTFHKTVRSIDWMETYGFVISVEEHHTRATMMKTF